MHILFRPTIGTGEHMNVRYDVCSFRPDHDPLSTRFALEIFVY